mgnify:CR=1 FL=1
MTTQKKAGKPGVVCAEGSRDAVIGFVQSVRGLSWQKMSTKLQEKEATAPPERTIASLRKFSGFSELALATHGNRGSHRDTREFLRFLQERQLDHVFSAVFGIDPSGFLASSSSGGSKEKEKSEKKK